MPDKLEQYLPFVDAETRAQLFGSLYVVAAEPRGSPLREGVIMGAWCSFCLGFVEAF